MGKTTINLVYCGMAGVGPTVRDAKQDAARNIERVLSLNFTPSVFVWKGITGLVWNTPTGVCSAYVAENGGLGGTCFHGSSDIGRACAEMRLNLAMRGADIESDEVPSIIAGDKLQVRDFNSWLGFQRAFRKATTDGADSNQAHQWACNHSSEFDPSRVVANAPVATDRDGNPHYATV